MSYTDYDSRMLTALETIADGGLGGGAVTVAQLPVALGQTGNTGSLSVTFSTEMQVLIEAITAAIVAGVASSLPGGTATIGGTFEMASATANGATCSRITSSTTTNATPLKATAGRVYGIHLFNTTSAYKYFKLYNDAGTPDENDTPVWTIPLPPNGGYSETFPAGRSQATGVAYRITGAYADNDTTVTAAADVVGSIQWI
jgi:hypothetical protein